ncbi:YdeI/OmpD-associated family protein [Robiginitalea sp. IMCC43444]|uniref:YdeI/OmpD-associated family protein n=1 Tax=Robiginitalea sp. IMCC43444 TaxID=3459121 RepID=UPI00404189E1
MDKAARLNAYFEKEQPFRDGIARLREIALQCGMEERLKWNAPVYCVENKNVLGILAFKNHFGLWFFDGAFLSDPLSVLENAQQGKTKGMRHWKFYEPGNIPIEMVRQYIEEAIANAIKGIGLKPAKPKKTEIPAGLYKALQASPELQKAFDGLTLYKQNEYAEYIASAKQEATKQRRLQKILPMIAAGKGLNDKYR